MKYSFLYGEESVVGRKRIRQKSLEVQIKGSGIRKKKKNIPLGVRTDKSPPTLYKSYLMTTYFFRRIETFPNNNSRVQVRDKTTPNHLTKRAFSSWRAFGPFNQ